MPEPIWVRDDVVRAIHLRLVAEHGGNAGIRDEGLLASALARPRNLLAYADDPPDLAALAAAYAFGISANHPFIDGNKRTALVVCRVFLLLNGHDIAVPRQAKLETFWRLAAGAISQEELGSWIRAHLRPAC